MMSGEQSAISESTSEGDVASSILQPSWQLLVGGALLATAGWRHPILRGAAVAAGGAGIYVLGRRWWQARAEQDAGASQDVHEQASARGAERMQERYSSAPADDESRDEVDRASQESFPASDPPSFTPGSGAEIDIEDDALRAQPSRYPSSRPPMAPDIGSRRSADEGAPAAPDVNLDDWTTRH